MISLVAGLVIGAAIAGLLSWRLHTFLPTMVAFALHAGAAVLIYAFVGPLAANDSAHYHNQALQLLAGAPVEISAAKALLPYLLQVVYSLVGVEPGVVIALNVLFAAALPTVLGHVAIVLSLPARLTMWAAALVPQSFLWGVILLRESMVWFALSVIVLALAKLYKGERWAVWLPVVLGAFVLFAYARGTIAIVVAASVVLVTIFVLRSWRVTGILVLAIVVIGLVAPGFGAIMTRFGNDSVGAAKYVPDSTGTSVVPWAERGAPHVSSTTFEAPHVGDGLMNLLVTKAIGLLNVTLGPLPTALGDVGLIYFADGLVWVVLLALAIFGWVHLKDKRAAFIMIIPVAAILCAMGWTIFEFGSLVRLRMMPLYVLLPLSASGAVAIWRRLRRTAVPVPSGSAEPASS